MSRVVLLDRDGTLVVDHEYLADPAGLEFLPGAVEGLQLLHRRGHRLVIISNQSGVGRGLFSLEQLRLVNERLAAMAREIGVELAGIYCCPHRPEDGCNCRKPAIGLVRQAAAELGFEPSATVVIGDKASDMELGRAIGAVTIRIIAGGARPEAPLETGSQLQADSAGSVPNGPEHLAANLFEAAEILERLPVPGRRQTRG